MTLNKEQQVRHEQKLIANLNHKLFQLEMRIMQGINGVELQKLESAKVRIEVRLMNIYSTEKYGLVH